MADCLNGMYRLLIRQKRFQLNSETMMLGWHGLNELITRGYNLWNIVHEPTQLVRSICLCVFGCPYNCTVLSAEKET